MINCQYGCYQDGRRLALYGGIATLCLHRNPERGIWERRAEPYGYIGTYCRVEFWLDMLWNRIYIWQG